MKKLRSKFIDWWFWAITFPRMERQKRDLFIILINRMLRKYRTWYQNLWHFFKPTSSWGIGYKYVIDNPKINGEDWYIHFTMTTAEDEAFEKFAKRKISKSYQYTVDKEYGWFHMCYGLKISDYDDNNDNN